MKEFTIIKNQREQSLIIKLLDFLTMIAFLKEAKVIKKNGKFPLYKNRWESRSGYAYYMTLVLKKFLTSTLGLKVSKERNVDNYRLELPERKITIDKSYPRLMPVSVAIANDLTNASVDNYRRQVLINIPGEEKKLYYYPTHLKFQYIPRGSSVMSFFDKLSEVNTSETTKDSIKILIDRIFQRLVYNDFLEEESEQEPDELLVDLEVSPSIEVETQEVQVIDILDQAENREVVEMMRSIPGATDSSIRTYLRETLGR